MTIVRLGTYACLMHEIDRQIYWNCCRKYINSFIAFSSDDNNVGETLIAIIKNEMHINTLLYRLLLFIYLTV